MQGAEGVEEARGEGAREQQEPQRGGNDARHGDGRALAATAIGEGQRVEDWRHKGIGSIIIVAVSLRSRRYGSRRSRRWMELGRSRKSEKVPAGKRIGIMVPCVPNSHRSEAS